MHPIPIPIPYSFFYSFYYPYSYSYSPDADAIFKSTDIKKNDQKKIMVEFRQGILITSQNIGLAFF